MNIIRTLRNVKDTIVDMCEVIKEINYRTIIAVLLLTIFISFILYGLCVEIIGNVSLKACI